MGQKDKFGFFSIVLLGINSIVGSGIFLMPGKAYSLVGTSSLFVYMFITILAGSIALCFAEVSGLFDSNGGAYIYAKEAFGDFAGFEVGLMKYLMQMIAWAAMACAFTTALGAVVPVVQSGFWYNFTIVSVIVGLSIINLLGVDMVKTINDIATVGKLVPLIVFIVVGIFFADMSKFEPIVPSTITQGNFSEAAILIFYGFTGFEAMVTAAEDMEDPKKNLPRAIIAVVGSVSVIYFLTQFISIGVLGHDLAGLETPFVDAIGVFLGEWGKKLVVVGTLVSVAGINIAASFSTPRQCEALAYRNMLPKSLAKTNSKNIPYLAVILTAAIALPIALSGNFVFLATVGVIARFVQYVPTCLSVLVFRKRGMVSTFKMPFGYTIPTIALIGTFWLLFHAAPIKIISGLGALILFVPIYFGMKHHNKKHNLEFN